MPKSIDLTGLKYGRFEVLELYDNRPKLGKRVKPQELISMYRSGMTVSEIEKIKGIEGVRKKLESLGVKFRSSRKARKKELIKPRQERLDYLQGQLEL